MKKLYEKHEVGFALVWIGLYVVVMNVALHHKPHVCQRQQCFSGDRGPFHSLLAAVFGQVSPELAQLCSAGGIILLSGSYAWWLWKKA